MIACPSCGAKTAVAETRVVGASVRRRRRCVTAECNGKVTTVEVVVSAARDFASGDVVPVPTRQIAALKKIVAAIGGGAE
jgi:transcriptional regulator NrdR family protein